MSFASGLFPCFFIWLPFFSKILRTCTLVFGFVFSYALGAENFTLVKLDNSISTPNDLIMNLDLEVKNKDRTKSTFFRISNQKIDSSQKLVIIQEDIRTELVPPALVDGQNWYVIVQERSRKQWTTLHKLKTQLFLNETNHVLEGDEKSGAFLVLKVNFSTKP